MTSTTRTPSGSAPERSAAEERAAERGAPSRRTLALAAAATVLVAAPLALIAGAPDDESSPPAADTGASATASGAAADPAARSAAAAPAQLPPLLFASDRAPRAAAASDGTAGDGSAGTASDGTGGAASDGTGGDRAPGYRLYAADPDGRGVVEVVDGLAMFPAWSHDGTRIAYVGEAAGFTARRAALAVVEADGAVRDVVAGPQVPSRPAFRDGDGELWFQSSLQGSNGAAGVSERATIDAVDLRDGRPRTMLDRGGAIYQPSWSPDGTRLAVVLGDPACREGARCRQTLAVSEPTAHPRGSAAASGGGDSAGASADPRSSAGAASDTRGSAGLKLRTLVADGAPGTPAWSPDGERIAFTWDRGEGPQIWVVTVADGSVRQVTRGARPAAEPTWSPDGASLAFSRACDLFVQRIGARTATNVTRTPRACEISPAWRPEAPR